MKLNQLGIAARSSMVTVVAGPSSSWIRGRGHLPSAAGSTPATTFIVKRIHPPTADTRPAPAATEEDSPPRGRRLRKVILSITSVLLTLVSLEVGLRVWGFDPFVDVGKGREAMIRPSANRDLQYEMTPGAKGRAWGTKVSVNSAGFRGPEPSLRVESTASRSWATPLPSATNCPLVPNSPDCSKSECARLARTRRS